MSFPVTAVQVLLSSPSDLPEAHKVEILKTVHQWNSDYAEMRGVIFLPTDWQTASSSAYGAEPQFFINQQVVEKSDVGIVVFTDRLGTPTANYPSGTAEEIALLAQAGKRVAILQNNTPRPPTSGPDALTQREKLERFLEEHRDNGLFFEYTTVDQLGREVLKVLNSEASKFERLSTKPSTTSDLGETSGVWATVEHESYQEMDSKGRLKARQRHYLILTNLTGGPVTDVSYRYENDGEGEAHFDFGFEKGNLIHVLPPNGTYRHPIAQVMGSSNSADCIVNWTALDGTVHESTSTVSIR